MYFSGFLSTPSTPGKVQSLCGIPHRHSGLQNKRLVRKQRMRRHTPHRIQPDLSLADAGMAVFVRTAVVHAVVKMYRAQAVQTDHMVKFLQDTIRSPAISYPASQT